MSDIFGAIIGQNAQDQAIGAERDASQQAIGELQREYDTSRSDLAPYRTTGGSALDSLAQLYGLATSGPNGTTKPGGAPDMSNFFTSPDYQFRMQQGLAGVDAGAAAHGSLDSGATRKAEIGYAGNLASGEFNNYANRLAGIAGVGQTAVNTGAQLGANTANNIAGLDSKFGDNLASSYLASGNMWGNAIGGALGQGAGLAQLIAF